MTVGNWEFETSFPGFVLEPRGDSVELALQSEVLLFYKRVGRFPFNFIYQTRNQLLQVSHSIKFQFSNMFGSTKNTSTRNGIEGAPRTHKSHELIQHLLRVLQFLSALTSLILFSVRLAKIVRLAHKASRANGAVEGILAAAVLYTVIATAISFGLKARGGNMLRLLMIVLDVLFVGAFIAVAILTSPRRRGSSGPCSSNAHINGFLDRNAPSRINCNLPWGTFILAIFST